MTTEPPPLRENVGPGFCEPQVRNILLTSQTSKRIACRAIVSDEITNKSTKIPCTKGHRAGTGRALVCRPRAEARGRATPRPARAGAVRVGTRVGTRVWGRADVCCLHVSARGREAVSPGGGDVKEWGSWQTGTPRSQAYVTILTLFCWLSFPHRVHPALQIVTLTSL